MAPEVTTRALEREAVTPEFLEEAVALLERAFGTWPRVTLSVPATEHLEWKMNGPLPGFPAALIGEVDGELAGLRVCLARNVLVRGEPKLFLHFVDAGVDPAMQGLGVNRAVQQTMHDDWQPRFDLSIDDSTNPHMIHGRTRLGNPQLFGNAPRPAMLPLEASRIARGHSGRLPAPLAALRLRVASAVTRAAGRGLRVAPSDVAIRTIDRFDERFEAFCAAASAPFEFIAERNPTFLNWRYADPRAGRYTIRAAARDGALLGYAVTSIEDGVTHVSDLLVLPGELEVVAALLEDAIDGARAAGSAALSCWLPPRHPYRGAFRAAGLFTLGDTAVLYRPVSMPAEELEFLQARDASMHLMHGDTDFI